MIFDPEKVEFTFTVELYNVYMTSCKQPEDYRKRKISTVLE